MSPGPGTTAADDAKIYPPWIVVFLAAWLGTVAGGLIFGFACGLMPFWFLGPMATITGLYGAFIGLLLTTIGSLPISLILTGIVRLLPSHRRTRENYIIAAVITPTSDATTLIMVSLPLYFLYEISIFVSAYVKRKKA